MRLGLTETFAAAALLAIGIASPAHAQMPPPPPPPPMMHGAMGHGPMGHGPMEPMHGGQGYDGGWAPPMESPGAYEEQRAEWEAARADWLDECRYNHRERRHRGLLGAVFGGAIGGVIGHEIAGRDDRVLGTVAGAAIGAVAGSAIERGSGRHQYRNGAADWCESYLDYYAAPQTRMMMVPMPAPQREPCVETVTVTTEYVDGPRHRTIPPRPHRVIHDKRILITPDKRIRM